jgi:hypothetical protein
LVPLSPALGSTAVGLAILLFGHAPRDVIALGVAMLVTLFACAIVTRWWKISLHSAVPGRGARPHGDPGDRGCVDRTHSGRRGLLLVS